MTMPEKKEVRRASKTTSLELGLLKAPDIKLYKVIDTKDPSMAEFVKAGPRGGELSTRLSVEAPVIVADPLSIDHAGTEEKIAAELPEVQMIETLPGGEEHVITEEDVRRGIRLEDGTFVDCTDQLTVIEEDSMLERMIVERFIRREAVPLERVIMSYYIGPSDPFSQKVCALLLRSMRGLHRAAVVRWTLRSRQGIGVVTGTADGKLVLHHMAWEEQVRSAMESCVLKDVAVTAEEIAATDALVTEMSADGYQLAELETLRDDAVVRRQELVDAALAGKIDTVSVERHKEPETGDMSVVDLLAESARRRTA